MSAPFPITINGACYTTTAALAAEIAERADLNLAQEHAWGHPRVYFERWIQADHSGATRRAVLLFDGYVVEHVGAAPALQEAIRARFR